MPIPLFHSRFPIGSLIYDLSHLTAFGAAIPGKGNPKGSDLGVVVVFSNHVFTVRTEHGQPHHLLDHNGSKRSFDPERYEMSKKLSQLLGTAIETNQPAYVSRSFAGVDNLIVLRVDGGRTWSIVFCFEPINGGVRMEVLSAHPKVVDQAKISRKSISYFARKCIFQNKRIPENERPSRS